jgi:hypothetical protein
MKKWLKQSIFETLSTLRNPFVKLRVSRGSKTTEISNLGMEVTKMKTELEKCSGKHAKEHRTPLSFTVQNQVTRWPRNTTCYLCSTLKNQLGRQRGVWHYLAAGEESSTLKPWEGRRI